MKGKTSQSARRPRGMVRECSTKRPMVSLPFRLFRLGTVSFDHNINVFSRRSRGVGGFLLGSGDGGPCLWHHFGEGHPITHQARPANAPAALFRTAISISALGFPNFREGFSRLGFFLGRGVFRIRALSSLALATSALDRRNKLPSLFDHLGLFFHRMSLDSLPLLATSLLFLVDLSFPS